MDKKTLTGLTKQRHVIGAYSTLKIDYNDTQPNYYRVQNAGKTPIYCGTSHMPTSNNYDFMCNAESMKMYAEPFKRSSLYIYNPSGNEVAVVVLSFSAEFDPLTLALSEISLDLPTADLGISSVISSFETPLPAGSNKIGKVDLDSMPESYVALINSILTAINNKTFNADISGDVYATVDNTDVVNAIRAKTIDHSDVISAINAISLDNSDVVNAIRAITFDNSDVVSAIQNKTIDHSAVISAIASAVASMQKPKQVTSIGANASIRGYEYVQPKAGTGKKITCIDFIANDGEEAVVIDMGDTSFNLKAGEVLNNVRCYLDSFMICADFGAVDVRYLLTVEEV